ncbi:MAG: DNA translocase FtsK [Eubacteriaceae bacterium]|jgi:S-DNA-T family DNA segregation ATPase FtsK/SpoIIIE|nr:DNA translocase FtsK [Eubacteriaceae bacterium]
MADKKSTTGKKKKSSQTAKKKTAGKNSAAQKKKTAARNSAAQKKKAEEKIEKTDSRLKDEIAAIIMLALGAFLIVAVQTSLAGKAGAAIGSILKGCFGFGAVLLPYFIIVYSICVFVKATAPFRVRTVVLLVILFLMIDLINAGRFMSDPGLGVLSYKDIYSEGVQLINGGLFGTYAGGGLTKLIGVPGLYIFAAVASIVCIMLLINTPLSRLMEQARERKQARKARKEAAMAEKQAEKEARETQEAEFAAKREAVDKAGRQMEMDYRTPSERAAEITGLAESATENIPQADSKKPRSGFFSDIRKFAEGPGSDDDHHTSPEYMKRLPDNKRNILELVTDEDLFDSTGSEPASAFAEHDAEQGGSTGVSGFGKSIEDIGKPKNSGIGFENAGGMAAGAGAAAAAASLQEDMEKSRGRASGKYKLPPLSLLDPPAGKVNSKGLEKTLGARADLLEDTLRSFNVDAKVVNVVRGPAVTRYEIQPNVGVKVNSIVRLSDDIALNLRAKSIRIEAPIPGKAAIGIEVENEQREMVNIREILGSKEFINHKSKLAFAVGEDIGGRSIVANLDKMPHLLIAGATGSGKSVCINTIIMSFLYKARPDEVKLVLIDPKMVELGNYNGIPHLLIPVVTDASKAAAALNWAVSEMTDRYKKFASEGVRNINAYNAVMKSKDQKDEILPRIVVIIDELADLMMVASSQVEDAICRIAQLARAAGMHLIVATQRPSVDVVTGLIKANIPSRMAFMVSSQIDSRTIIDMPGAEKLVGNGDMLFKPQDLNKPIRVQCPFVSDSEVEKVIEYVKAQVEEVEYADKVIEHIESGAAPGGNDDEDELLSDAIECVVLAGQASVSMLQRRFRIGYNRAARIVDMMEARGIVGPQDGSRPRTVNMTEEELHEMQSGEE